MLTFPINFFQKFLSGTIVIQIRSNLLSVLIWVQTVCKCFQQTTKVAACTERVETHENQTNNSAYSFSLSFCSSGVGGAIHLGGDNCCPGYCHTSSSSSVSDKLNNRKLSCKFSMPPSGILVSLRHMGHGKCPGRIPGCLLT